MNLLNRIMSYDKTKLNQENCNCEECVSSETVKSENQIVEYPKLSEDEIEQIINERYSDKDDKTKTFIRKALRKHGDRYDYSNVIYVKATVNVEIICRVEGHKPFPQTPSNHLRGQGCNMCGGNKKLTLKEFIEKSDKVHGKGRYDYSKAKYVNMNTLVTIICHNHDEPYEFPQTPSNHLQGHGCLKCNGGVRMTLEEFIERANNIHGLGRYDYSKVIYINNDTEVIIICPKHDEPYAFPQKPRSHLNGSGCPLCYGTKKLTLEEFIERANDIHKGKYDYSKVNYVNMNTEVMIICPKHGEFPQTPSNHFKGAGCPDCWEEKKATLYNLTLEEFIERASKAHGIGTYDYSKVNYINMYTDVIITCPKHGDFPQQPNNHVSGEGCPKCNNYKGKLPTVFRL